MADLFSVLMVVSLVMLIVSGGDSAWLWCLLASALGLALWPTPEDREIRRQLRKVEQVRRERERLLNETARRGGRRGRGSGDWL